MANIKSQIKRIKTSRRQEEQNKAVKSALKTYIKQFELSLEKGGKEAEEALRHAVKALDKAAGRGNIHRNKAARKKSIIMRQYNEFLKAPRKEEMPEPEKPKKTKVAVRKTAAKPKTANTKTRKKEDK